MSARDDYPNLAARERSSDPRLTDALDEIDRLAARVAREQRAGSDAMADQTTHAESAVGESPTPLRALDEIDRIRAEFMAGVSEPQCWAELFDEIDRLRDLAAATEESRVKWQLRALESESHNFGLRKFARLILALDRTRAIDEVIEATPVGVLDPRPPVSVDFADLKGDEVP